MRDVRKVFIGRRGGIGDIILLTPIVRGLKICYPRCRLVVMVDDKMAEIARRMPNIDHVLVHSRKIVDTIRAAVTVKGADVALFLEKSQRPRILAATARIPVRIGEKTDRGINLLTHEVKKPDDYHRTYEVLNHAYFLKESIGLDLEEYTNLTVLDMPAVKDDEAEYVDMLLDRHGLSRSDFAVLNPFTAWRPREWPAENYRQLAVKLVDELGLKAVVVGGNTERELKLSVKIQNTDMGIINLCGRTTFMQLAEIIRRAALLVSGCTAPVHVAGAYGTPVVGLYGPSLPERFLPKRKAVGLCEYLPCGPCEDKGGPTCRGGYGCMQGITVGAVLSACEKARSFPG